jgi:hypothetical protein
VGDNPENRVNTIFFIFYPDSHKKIFFSKEMFIKKALLQNSNKEDLIMRGGFIGLGIILLIIGIIFFFTGLKAINTESAARSILLFGIIFGVISIIVLIYGTVTPSKKLYFDGAPLDLDNENMLDYLKSLRTEQVKQDDIEILKGLYETGKITKEEYEKFIKI